MPINRTITTAKTEKAMAELRWYSLYQSSLSCSLARSSGVEVTVADGVEVVVADGVVGAKLTAARMTEVESVVVSAVAELVEELVARIRVEVVV